MADRTRWTPRHHVNRPPSRLSRSSRRSRAERSGHCQRQNGGGLTDCPRSRDRDRRNAAQRHRRDRRCRPARLPRRLAGRRAGRRAGHAVRPKASACRSSRLERAGAPSRTRSAARPRAWPSDTLTGGRVRRLARPAAPRPPPPVLAARPGRPRAAPVPRRLLRPAAVAWRTRRPPPIRGSERGSMFPQRGGPPVRRPSLIRSPGRRRR